MKEGHTSPFTLCFKHTMSHSPDLVLLPWPPLFTGHPCRLVRVSNKYLNTLDMFPYACPIFTVRPWEVEATIMAEVTKHRSGGCSGTCITS